MPLAASPSACLLSAVQDSDCGPRWSTSGIEANGAGARLTSRHVSQNPLDLFLFPKFKCTWVFEPLEFLEIGS